MYRMNSKLIYVYNIIEIIAKKKVGIFRSKRPGAATKPDAAHNVSAAFPPKLRVSKKAKISPSIPTPHLRPPCS